VPPIYFSLHHVQPFADMTTEEVEDGVHIVRGDGKIVGLRLLEPQLVVRLPEIIERLGLEPERVWSKLRGDSDMLINRREAKWGGGAR
jgi:hypothetical protein